MRALLISLLVVGAGLFQFLPLADYLNAAGLDFLLPLRAASEQADAVDSPVVLVVIDETTHNAPPFSETPQVAWTPYLAKALDKVGTAGAAVIGFDMIFPKTLSSPDLLPGFDRPFVQSLYTIGRQGRLILSEARLSDTLIQPYEGQIQAVGGRQNVIPVLLTPDRDGVVRRYPASFLLENGSTINSFANALVARAGYPARKHSFLIDFASPQSIPAYRLADLLTCTAGDAPALAEIFKGRIVLFGTTLDIEDRHVAANRFAAHKGLRLTDGLCTAPTARAGTPQINRQSVPGVLLHALAVRTIVSGQDPQVLGRTARGAFSMGLVLLLALGSLHWRSLTGLAMLGTTLVAIWVAAFIGLTHHVLIPYLNWSLLALTSYFLLTTYRVSYEDQQKRWIKKAFRHYLSPALVDQLISNPKLLYLGGEKRRVAVMFLDLADFTALSEELSDDPEQLVDLLNDVLTRFTAVIEKHDGYIDKYVGDAVMAVWGAPVACANPEELCAKAALECRRAFENFRLAQDQNQTHGLKGLRIGLNAGPAIAGNIGSKARFDYTVIGDAVNVAARLEALNKKYGTIILASQEVARRLPPHISTRFVEETSVEGRRATIRLYEIINRRATKEGLSATMSGIDHGLKGGQT